MTPSQTPNESVARAAGRGGVAVLGAKAFFIVVGFAQQLLLPRAIGLAGYGAYSRVMAIANVLNNVVVGSSIQGVSRAVAGSRGSEVQATRRALRLHAPIAMAIAAAFAAAGPALAAFQKAPHIRAPLAVIAVVTLIYGLYAPLVGALNGRGEFVKQAVLDVGAASLRTVGLVAGGAAFVALNLSGTLGATVGAAVAAAIIVVPAAFWAIGRHPRASGHAAHDGPDAHGATHPSRAGTRSHFDARPYLRSLLPLALAQLFTNLVMQVDISLLGRFLSLGALNAGLTGDVAAKASDEAVAVYRFCQLFSFLPYQLLMSITQVLFPMIARAKAEGDRARIRLYTARGLRIGALACGLMVGVIAAMPSSLLRMAASPIVAERGTLPLRILVFGQGAFTLFGLGSTILTSLGRERTSAAISLATAGLIAAACATVVPRAAFGDAQLAACSAATTVSLFAALIVTAWFVTREAGAFLTVRTVARVGVATGSLAVVGSRLPPLNRAITPIVALALGALYVGILVVTRELSTEDFAALRGLAQRRRS